MGNDSYLAPKIFKIKNLEGNEIEINSWFIFYIKVTREIKIFHLTEPTKEDKTIEVHFKTKEFGVDKILKLLSGKGFIQINKTTIIRNLYISGRDHNWSYIYITMPINRTVKGIESSWRNVALPLGRAFASQVKKHVLESFLTVKNKEGDLFYINPINIAFIKSSQYEKTLYLAKPICHNDKNKYVLKWHSRNTFENLLNESVQIYFIQAHRNYYVGISYPFKIVNEQGKTILIWHKPRKGDHVNDNTFKIPVGEKFKKEIDEVFKNR